MLASSINQSSPQILPKTHSGRTRCETPSCSSNCSTICGTNLNSTKRVPSAQLRRGRCCTRTCDSNLTTLPSRSYCSCSAISTARYDKAFFKPPVPFNAKVQWYHHSRICHVVQIPNIFLNICIPYFQSQNLQHGHRCPSYYIS